MGQPVFVQTDAETGRIDYEAGVPASLGQSGVSVFLDSLGNRDTGLALVHAVPTSLIPTSEAAQVTATLFDKDTNLLATQEIELGEKQHRAQFIRELFPEIAEQASEMQGVIRVRADEPVAALTLRQTDDPDRKFPQDVPILTSFSAFPERVSQRVVYFPQIADGLFGNSRFQTSLIFVNTGFSTLTVTVEFFDSQGMPLEINLGDEGIDSVFSLRNLLPSQFGLLETSGEEEGKAGYVRVTSTSNNLGGTAVFRERNADGEVFDGVVFYEAGVPTSAPQRDFTIFVDTLGVLDTGVAMVNAAEEVGTITLRLYDKSFNLIAEAVLEVGAGQQVARFVWQFFPEIEAQVREMEGVLTVESTVPLAALTLRQNDNPIREFPSEVPTLTTFPVIPGSGQTLNPSL